MAGRDSKSRKPLSPVKANDNKIKATNKAARGRKLDSGDVVAQSATKPKNKPAEALRTSKIPRATPSPGPRRLSVGPSPPASQLSKIPRPNSAFRSEKQSSIPRPGSVSPPGFHAFSNPSFDAALQGAAAPPPNALSTPEAMQIMHEVARADNIDSSHGMGAIINAYLRTGPQKLSPEPSKDYCIVAPKPTAAAHATHLRPEAPAVAELPEERAEKSVQEQAEFHPTVEETTVDHAPTESQPLQAVVEYSEAVPEVSFSAFMAASPEKSVSGFGSVEKVEEDGLPETAPPSVCSNVPDVFGDLEDDEMENWGNIGEDEIAAELRLADLEEKAALEGENAPSSLEICVLSPVDSAGHAAEQVPDSPPTTQVQENVISIGTRVIEGCEQSPTLMLSPEETYNGPGRRTGRRPSPVAFTLPGSSDDSGSGAKGSDSNPASSGSFSFGLGGPAPANTNDPGSPPPEPFIAPAEQHPHGKDNKPQSRPGSADSVDQPNCFASMLNHLMDGDKGKSAYTSPAPNQRAPPAPIAEETLVQSPPQAAVVPATAAIEGCVMEDSPQSPANCTPMHLLSDGAPPSATPELGKGDLVAWIERRGMRGVLSSSAAADLRRMWDALRDGAAARTAAAATAAENEGLREELEEARAALERLGVEHSEALAAAQAGQQWAAAEVARAREAAQHMMALADQIQSTFALCEEEKAALAEELDAAWNRVAEAEQEAQVAASHFAASEEQLAAAAELQKDLQMAQDAAMRAAREAAEAQAAARTSAEELAAIKAQLEEAQQAMDGDENGDKEAALTPFSKMRAQLHAAHNALATLHASNRRQCATGASSPHIHRLLESSSQRLTQTHALLQQDADELHQANDELRTALSGVQARIMQLSPVRGDNARVEAAVEHSPSSSTVTVDYRELRDVLAEANLQGIPVSPPLHNPTGVNATTPEEPTCEMEVDGVVVTNIPSSAVSHVHAIVKYFEQLANGQPQALVGQEMLLGGFETSPGGVGSSISGGNSSPGADPGSTPGMSGTPQWSPLPTTAQRLRDFLPPRNGCTPAGGAVLSATGPPPRTPAATPYDAFTPPPQRLHRQTLDALAALQAYQSPVTDGALVVAGAGGMMTHYHHSAMEDDVVGPTPGQTDLSAESIGPLTQVDDLGFASQNGALVKEEEASFNSYADQYATYGGHDATEIQLQAPSPINATAPYHMDVSPMDLAALQQGGNGLRDEVRARLTRLKADLQAARSKLSYVDRGLAAIATPQPTRGAPPPITATAAAPLPEFVPQLAENFAETPTAGAGINPGPGPSTIAAGMVAAMAAGGPQLTPALAGPTPRTGRGTSRPSVRFAESVQFGYDEEDSSDDDNEITRRPIPRTPGISSTSSRAPAHAYMTNATAFSTGTMVASTMRAPPMSAPPTGPPQQQHYLAQAGFSQAIPAQRSPASSFAMLALGQQPSVKKEGASEELTQAQQRGNTKPSPLRRLNLGNKSEESESDSDDDLAPHTHGSTRSRVAMGTDPRGGNSSSIKAFYAPSPGASRYGYNGTPLAHPEFRSPYPGGASNSPLLSRFSSVSSGVGPAVPPSPESAALLGIRPAVVRGRRNGGNRRVNNDAEEREFRRRAAALGIHVSPYFKRAGGKSSRDEIDPAITVD